MRPRQRARLSHLIGQRIHRALPPPHLLVFGLGIRLSRLRLYVKAMEKEISAGEQVRGGSVGVLTGEW
jgi:hypothetical protein